MTSNEDAMAHATEVVLPQGQHLASAPLLEGWALAEGHAWFHGWFFDHPEIDDGTHGHTAPVLEMDRSSPPSWIRTESRVYRLGRYYAPAEREVRYWAQKHSGTALVRGDAPGGGDDIDAMLAYLRRTGRIRQSKIDHLEKAYRAEQDRASSIASTSE
ncbi:hypothetical protein G6L08_08520 [Agrobacterium rhizogenes]|nr:hypothetical protein [Rhizobium rhizogenes]